MPNQLSQTAKQTKFVTKKKKTKKLKDVKKMIGELHGRTIDCSPEKLSYKKKGK